MMESTQPRHAYNAEIERLEHDLLDMASRSESMVSQAVDALCRLDVPLAVRVMKMDDEVDIRDLAIETRCLKLLALQQPMGKDFREISAALKIITDVERVADLAVDIAKVGRKIDNEMGSSDFIDVRPMAILARRMFRESIEAFVKRDLELVRKICDADDEVDAAYKDLRAQIHEYMRRNPEHVVSASWMLLAIHHMERVADHAQNIAERVAYMITGQFEQLAASHLSTSA